MISIEIGCHLNCSPIYKVLGFLLAAFKIFSLSCDSSSLILISLCYFLPFGGSVNLLNLHIYSFHQIWEDFSYKFSSQISFFSPSGSLVTQMQNLSHMALRLCLCILFFSKFCLFLFRKDYCYWSIFKFGDFFLPLPLCYPVKFFSVFTFFVWFWYQGDGGLIEWVWECSFLCSFFGRVWEGWVLALL